MTIEIIIDGETKTVTKQELFGLVTSGKISTDTPVSVNGKLVTVETAVTMDSNEAVRPSSTSVRNETVPIDSIDPYHFSSELKKKCSMIGGIFVGIGLLGWFFIGGTPFLFFGGIVLTILGLILQVVGWVIPNAPEDPAILREREEQKRKQEEQDRRLTEAWAQMSEEERERISIDEPGRVPREVRGMELAETVVTGRYYYSHLGW